MVWKLTKLQQSNWNNLISFMLKKSKVLPWGFGGAVVRASAFTPEFEGSILAIYIWTHMKRVGQRSAESRGKRMTGKSTGNESGMI